MANKNRLPIALAILVLISQGCVNLRAPGAVTEKSPADTQYKLGYQYEIGAGGPVDFEKAVYWYKLAAAQGNSWAQRGLDRILPPASSQPTSADHPPETISTISAEPQKKNETHELSEEDKEIIRRKGTSEISANIPIVDVNEGCDIFSKRVNIDNIYATHEEKVRIARNDCIIRESIAYDYLKAVWHSTPEDIRYQCIILSDSDKFNMAKNMDGAFEYSLLRKCIAPRLERYEMSRKNWSFQR